MKIDRIVLFPYTLVLALRNFFYDKGILKSYPSALPSISVGNITVGGTGKTPAVEMLIRLYRDSRKIAVVSRGYGRRTKGFRTVSVDDDYRDVGDEPLQIKRKFPDIIVAVDASRRRAVDALAAMPEETRPDLVILDDAFQHRRIRPDFSIVLVSSARPVFKDSLLPIGRLRDLPSQIKRADMVIVTKMDGSEVPSSERERWRKALKMREDSPLLFSRIAYRPLMPVMPGKEDSRYIYAKSAIVISGIADDRSLRRGVGWSYSVADVLCFRDHHGYRLSDISKVDAAVRRYPTAVVLTTEKDAQRLRSMEGVPVRVSSRLFYIPIESEIIPDVNSGSYLEQELPELGYNELKNYIKIPSCPVS